MVVLDELLTHLVDSTGLLCQLNGLNQVKVVLALGIEREYGRDSLFQLKVLFGYALEKTVLHDFDVVVVGAKPFVDLFLEELLDQINDFVRVFDLVLGFRWEFGTLVEYPIREHLSALVEERSYANEHFVDDDPDRPPVHGLVVGLLADQLRGFVLRRARVMVQSHLVVLHHFGVPEVNYLDVAVLLYHDVLSCQVAVHDAFAVQVPYSQNDLSRVEPDLLLLKSASVLSQNVRQNSPLNVGHNEEKPLVSLNQKLHAC